MQRRKGYKTLALLGVISLLFLNISCDRDGDRAKELLGSWTSREVDSDGIIIEGKTMYMDGGKVSFMGAMKSGTQEIPVIMSGTWEVKNGHIHTAVMTSNIPQLIPSGFTIVEKIVSINDKELVTQDPEGSTSVYTRVR